MILIKHLDKNVLGSLLLQGISPLGQPSVLTSIVISGVFLRNSWPCLV